MALDVLVLAYESEGLERGWYGEVVDLYAWDGRHGVGGNSLL